MTATSTAPERDESGPRRRRWRRWAACGAGVAVLALTAGGAPAPQGGARTPPGAEPRAEELAARLWAAYAAMGPEYEPRSEHRRDDGSPVYVNRLILESSPYLRQHAHNPVDWYPWGEEAFAKARREEKPIFLSIGYSTCHWCHVMEEESFDDEEVARRLNEGFVAIKVDREQRPDVDDVYMTAVQLTTGRGGWPMSSFLTPEGDPFFGGTYFPRATFLDLLDQGVAAWEERRGEVEAEAARLAAAVARVTAAGGEAEEVGREAIAAAAEAILARHDPELGGFSPAPKFPHEPELLFLLDRALRAGDGEALDAADLTLRAMARGGIHDQVGGGFHRYSTDARWRVPHFEKMLYNQAHLARAYLEAWRLTGDPLHERVVRSTLDYVLREMTSAEGAFHSATDADSEGREGAFFLWTPAEVRAALPEEDAELAIRLFGVSEAGDLDGESVLHLPRPLPEVARDLELPLDALLARVDGVRRRLREVRAEREPPLTDDKVITAWNGMMITALARAGDLLGDERYLAAARRAAGFLVEAAGRPGGGLWRIHLDGGWSVEGTLADHAHLAEALLALADATGDPAWLERAEKLAGEMVERFWDPAAGGFFLAEDDHGGRLPARPKSPMDGAVPSANSVAVRVLVGLAVRGGDAGARRRAEATLAAFAGPIRRAPSAFAYMLLGAAELTDGLAGPVGFAGRGVVRAEAVAAEGSSGDGSSSDGRIELRLELAEGWHIQSDAPLQAELIATRLAAADEATAVADVVYPPAERLELGFSERPVAVFRGSVAIGATVAVAAEAHPPVARLALTVQPCDDERCLRPEEIRLELPAAGSRSGPGAEPVTGAR